jgi:hypothetical protein
MIPRKTGLRSALRMPHISSSSASWLFLTISPGHSLRPYWAGLPDSTKVWASEGLSGCQ